MLKVCSKMWWSNVAAILFQVKKRERIDAGVFMVNFKRTTLIL